MQRTDTQTRQSFTPCVIIVIILLTVTILNLMMVLFRYPFHATGSFRIRSRHPTPISCQVIRLDPKQIEDTMLLKLVTVGPGCLLRLLSQVDYRGVGDFPCAIHLFLLECSDHTFVGQLVWGTVAQASICRTDVR